MEKTMRMSRGMSCSLFALFIILVMGVGGGITECVHWLGQRKIVGTPANQDLDVIQEGHKWHVVHEISQFEVVRTAADAWALYRRGEDRRMFAELIATADKAAGLETLANAKALYWKAYGKANSLSYDMSDITETRDRVNGLKVSVSEVPGKDFVTASTGANAIDLARIVQWYWTPNRATKLEQ